MKGRRAIAAALASATLTAVACEQALSIDGPVVVAPREACGLPVSVSACQACLATKCCAQASACAGEPSCRAHERCMLGCGADYGCRARCEVAEPATFPSGVPALDTCIAQGCNDACGLSCGVNSSFADPDAAATCQLCIAAADICDKAETCAKDLTCENTLHCGIACTTSDCQTACVERFDGGAFVSYQSALASACLTQCQLGSVWGCVGRVSWPFAKSSTLTATLTLTDSTTGAAVQGAVAKSCDRSDQPCAMPFGTGTSDAEGKVTLTLPPANTASFGFNGYFDLAPPNGRLPYLVFTDAPLSEPNAKIGVSMIATSTLLGNLASAAGAVLDPKRGHVAVVAADCILAPATGAVISAQGIDAQTKLFYYGSGSLDPSATATTVSGLAFLFNVPSGLVSIEAMPRVLGGRVSSKEAVFARPGALSVVGAPPTP